MDRNMEGGGGSRGLNHPTNLGQSIFEGEEEDDPNENSITTGGEGVAAAARQSSRSEHYDGGLIPVASIVRVMRKALPAHAQITEEAKEAVQRFVYDFMVHATAVANESCHREHRRTVTAEDMLLALGKLGLRDYVEYLSLYLNRYRLLQGDHRPARRDHLLSQVVGTAGSGSGAFPPWPAAYPAPPPPAATAGSQGSYSARFFQDEGGSSSAAAAIVPGAGDVGAGAMTTAPEQEGNAATPSPAAAGPSHWPPPQPFGRFDPFSRYG